MGPSTPPSNSASSSALDAYASSPQRSDFFRVLIWMLTHDLLVMLHVRVRIYVSREIKAAALKAQRAEKELRAANKAKKQARKVDLTFNRDEDNIGNGNSNSVLVLKTHSSSSIRSSTLRLAPVERPNSPHVPSSNYQPRSHSISRSNTRELHMKHKHAVSFDKIISVEKTMPGSAPASHGESSESALNDEDEELSEGDDNEDSDPNVRSKNAPREFRGSEGKGSESGGAQTGARRGSKHSSEIETSELEEDEDQDLSPTFLNNPERATRAQRRWLDEICRGEDLYMVRGFRR